ncbi:hypothetical protein PFISCL1PPCAC_21224, partial [Pristionchus fissidentatus]
GCKLLEITPDNLSLREVSHPGVESDLSLSDEKLRELLNNKSNVFITRRSENVTAIGLRTMWENLLNAKFDGLQIIVSEAVADELFNLIRADCGNTSSEEKIEVEGRIDKSTRYEIWRDSRRREFVSMSRIYVGQRWMSNQPRAEF